jgi:nucleoside-diphosphate-sugar epimerase
MAMGQSNQPGPINLGNPRENTLLELAKMVTQIVGGSGEIEFLELPADDPKKRNPEISKARSLYEDESLSILDRIDALKLSLKLEDEVLKINPADRPVLKLWGKAV